jgi:hypothetical protein
MSDMIPVRFRSLAMMGIVLVVIALGLGSFSMFFSNVWLLLTGEEFEIPVESSIFTFHASILNDGSGDWWLYGEDERNYYWYTGQPSRAYVAYSKIRAMNCRGFDPHNEATWCP